MELGVGAYTSAQAEAWDALISEFDSRHDFAHAPLLKLSWQSVRRCFIVLLGRPEADRRPAGGTRSARCQVRNQSPGRYFWGSAASRQIARDGYACRHADGSGALCRRGIPHVSL